MIEKLNVMKKYFCLCYCYERQKLRCNITFISVISRLIKLIKMSFIILDTLLNILQKKVSNFFSDREIKVYTMKN